MLGTSLVVGWFIAMHLAKQDGIDQQEAGSLYMWGAVWSIIGSRLLWYFTTPSATIGDIPLINQGGLVAYGGMIGGTLATWYCCRKRGIPLLQWADVAAPSVVLGTAITRIGCFLFGCDYGKPSEPPLGRAVSEGQPGLAPPCLASGRSASGDRRLVISGPSDAALRVAGRAFPVCPSDVDPPLPDFLRAGVHRLGGGIRGPALADRASARPTRTGVLYFNGLLSTSQIIGIVSVGSGSRPVRRAAAQVPPRSRKARASGCTRWRRRAAAQTKVEQGGGKRRKRR